MGFAHPTSFSVSPSLILRFTISPCPAFFLTEKLAQRTESRFRQGYDGSQPVNDKSDKSIEEEKEDVQRI
jgi:hypothetical protein